MSNAMDARLESILVPANEASRLMGVSARTIDNWRKDEGLPSVKIGGRRLYDPAAIRRWVESHQTEISG